MQLDRTTLLMLLVGVMLAVVAGYSLLRLTAAETAAQELSDSFVTCNETYTELKASCESETLRLTASEEQLTGQVGRLTTTSQQCAANKTALETGLNQCQATLALQQGKMDEVSAKIDSYKNEINQSLSWFHSNGNLEGGRVSFLKSPLANHCFQVNEGTCTIRLPCLPFISEDQAGVTYISDYTTSGKADELQSLEQVLKNGGGDCEDLSMLFAAQLRYLLEECGKQGATVSLDAMKADAYREYLIAYGWDWVYKGFSSRPVGFYSHVYVVCGLLPENYETYQAGRQASGHCVAALANQAINSASDIYPVLSSSILVEPQSGVYLANLAARPVLVLPQENATVLDNMSAYVSIVITDSDLYSYDSGTKSWDYNQLFLNELDTLQQALGTS